jgi:hypothetical protein
VTANEKPASANRRRAFSSDIEPFGREGSDNMELGIATAFVENTNAAFT